MTVRGRKSFSVNRGSQPCQCTVPPPTIWGTGQNSSMRASSSAEVRTVRGFSSGSGHRLYRLTLASSSPPKVSLVRHGPRSSPTTRSPRWVSTLAAAAPEAPAPMMHTSARSGFALRAMGFLRTGFGEIGEDAVPPGVHLGERRGPGEADDVPTDPVAVAAVDRVGVEALPGVQGQQREEVEVDLDAGLLQRGLDGRPRGNRLGGLQLAATGFHPGQNLVLLGLGQVGEGGTEVVPAAPVQLVDPVPVLVADDVQPLLPGVGAAALQGLEAAAVRLGVDVIEPGQVPVEEINGTGLAGTWGVVGGDDAGHRGLDGRALVRVEVHVSPPPGVATCGTPPADRSRSSPRCLPTTGPRAPPTARRRTRPRTGRRPPGSSRPDPGRAPGSATSRRPTDPAGRPRGRASRTGCAAPGTVRCPWPARAGSDRRTAARRRPGRCPSTSGATGRS